MTPVMVLDIIYWRLALPLLSKIIGAGTITISGFFVLLPTNASAQDGPACEVLRATDLARILPGDIGYNSFTTNEGAFQISNCNAIAGTASVSLRMISFLNRPSGSDQELQNILLDRYDPNIPFLTGEQVTDTAVSYSAKGDLIFWSADTTEMYIVDEEPDQMERTRRIARLIATPLGLANEPVSIFD